MGRRVNLKEYENVLDDLLKDLREYEETKLIPEKFSRIERILKYMVTTQSEIRGYAVAKSYSYICGASTKNQIHLSYVLGWCLQFMLGHWEMMDDYFDDDEGRWGVPTWYYNNSRQPIVINDALLVKNAANYILGKYFGTHVIYPKLVEYFSAASYEYSLGQSMELQSSSKGALGMDGFNMENYLKFNRYINMKTFFTARYELAMILAECPKNLQNDLRKPLETISLDLVYYSTLRDDITDNFGEKKKNKVCDKDIRTGKCKWPIVKAKELCSPCQWRKLKLAYGKDDQRSVNIVKATFMELEISEVGKGLLKEFEYKIGNNINKLINEGYEVSRVFNDLLEFFSQIE